MLSIITPLLLFIAFLLLLLVSVSVPIIKTIYLFNLILSFSSSLLNSSVGASAKFGAWGYCYSGVDVNLVGSQHQTDTSCSKVHLGYTFDETIGNALHISGYEKLISRTLTAALVLHPIACGLTFLALLVSLSVCRRGSWGASRMASLLVLAFGSLAGLIATIVFFVDIGLVRSVGSAINDATDGDLQLRWGNAVWLTLGAALAIWASLIGVCANMRRNRPVETY